MKLRALFPLIALSLMASGIGARSARAERYVLFESTALSYGMVEDYDRIVGKLQPGDELVFSNGRIRRIGQRLGSGNTTLIYELADDPDRAIRFPLRIGDVEFNEPRFTEYVKDFQNGAEMLQTQKVPMVRIFEDALLGEYSVVERLPKSITLRDFFLGGTLEGVSRSTLEDALVEFAKKSAAFEKIGDFHFDQLIYHTGKKEWVLADWTKSHRTMSLRVPEFIEVGTSIFVGPPQFRGKYFHEFLRVEEPKATQMVFKPLKAENEWIARLAQRLHAEIRQERLRRVSVLKNVSEPVAPVVPRSACVLNSFWKSFF